MGSSGCSKPQDLYQSLKHWGVNSSNHSMFTPRLNANGTPPRIMLTSASLWYAGGQQAEMLAKFDGLLKARKPHGDPTVLYISDAAVKEGFDVKDMFIRFKAELAKIGVHRIIPVELSFVSPMMLTKLLEGADCVYVEIGNAFYLRYAMHTSGLDRILPPLVRHSGLVYVGASSGAIVAGRSISTAFWKGWDDTGYGQVWDLSRIGYDGLNLLPGGQSVFPHYGAQWTSLVEAKRGELGHSLLLIHDWEVHLAGSSAERAPVSTGPSQSVFSSRSTIGSLSTVAEVKRDWLGHSPQVIGDRQVHLVGDPMERSPINKPRSASVYSPFPLANTDAAHLVSVVKPFPSDFGASFALPTFADSPSKVVPTTVSLAYESLIGG